MSKKNTHRNCPALGKAIDSKECGQGRHRTITCTAGCEFNVFAPANYTQFLEVEDSVDVRMWEFIKGGCGGNGVVKWHP